MADNRFEWKGQKGSGGHITVTKDERGLPVLNIEVDDDHYSGVMDQKNLMRLLNAIAEVAVEERVRRLNHARF